MWSGFDPELRRQLATIRQLVGLRHQPPTREWPLVSVAEHDDDKLTQIDRLEHDQLIEHIHDDAQHD